MFGVAYPRRDAIFDRYGKSGGGRASLGVPRRSGSYPEGFAASPFADERGSLSLTISDRKGERMFRRRRIRRRRMSF